MKHYAINECYLSAQGEGVRSGTMNVFCRFQGCNLKCSMEPGPLSPGFFDCDTEFASGRKLTLDEIALWCGKMTGHEFTDGLRASPWWPEPWIILTGGEPGLQVDSELIDFWHGRGVKLAIETNGTIALPEGLDWVTLSPKVAEHAVKQLTCDEVKYVRGLGQAIPKPSSKAKYKLISPAFEGNHLDEETMRWCLNLVKENPEWRLSVQMHKAWRVR